MGSIKIKDEDALNVVLRTFSFLDEIRWRDTSNYNTINFAYPEPSDDEILLTHWLCYVSDRQMPFRRIWDVGGYVISNMVHDFYNGTELPALKDKYVCEFYENNRRRVDIRCPLIRENRTLENYGYETGNMVQFSSRYMAEDLTRMFATFRILSEISDRSIGRFMALMLQGQSCDPGSVRLLARALNGLTYDLHYAFSDLPSKLSVSTFDAALKTILCGVLNTDVHFPDCDADFFSRKRLWCSIRDFMKSGEFNPPFVNVLSTNRIPNAADWTYGTEDSREALTAIELPGDVWNNRDVFRGGLFSPYLEGERTSWRMPQTVREIFNSLSESSDVLFYPEQLDVTFDFVPRMCERRLGGICVFGQGIGQICHHQAGLSCSVALVTCGYLHECNPDDCPIILDAARGLCSGCK